MASLLKYLWLTPAFQRWIAPWKENPPPNLEEMYRSHTARADQFLCVLAVAWPEFIEKEGMILRKLPFMDDEEQWQERMRDFRAAGYADTQIEYVLNHIHISDAILNDPDRDTLDLDVYLTIADTMAEMWRYKLAAMYPDKKFEVGVGNREDDPEVYAVTIREDE